MTSLKPATPARTVRLTTEEDRVLRQAAELLEQPVSQFVQAGVVSAAHRLGFFPEVKAIPTPFNGPWPDVPERGEESTSKRTTVTFEAQTLDLLQRAAAYVEIGETMFIIGATLRYLADLRQTDKRLRRLKLPAKYEAQSPPKKTH